MNNNFFDRYGLLHVEQGHPSENGVLFAAEYFFTEKLISGRVSIPYVRRVIKSSIVSLEPFRFQANPPQNGDHFSHDNLTGLYACAALLGSFRDSGLPVMRWNSRTWWHPRDILFYSLMKEYKWTLLFFPLICLFLSGSALVSCLKERANTSGKLLWWLRVQMMIVHPWWIVRTYGNCMKKIIIKCVERNHGVFGYADVAGIYFKNINHPIRINMERLYV